MHLTKLEIDPSMSKKHWLNVFLSECIKYFTAQELKYKFRSPGIQESGIPKVTFQIEFNFFDILELQIKNYVDI